MGLPIIVSDYRERKILKRFQVTPVSPAMLLGVEFVIYILYAAVSLFTLIFVSMLFLGFTMRGSWLSFLGSWFLTLLSTLSIGMLVGGIARNTKSAGVIASILYFPMLVFSGTTLPFEVMPETMQRLVRIFPLTQGIQLMKASSLGLRMEHVWVPVTVMGVVTIVCATAAIRYFQWE